MLSVSEICGSIYHLSFYFVSLFIQKKTIFSRDKSGFLVVVGCSKAKLFYINEIGAMVILILVKLTE